MHWLIKEDGAFMHAIVEVPQRESPPVFRHNCRRKFETYMYDGTVYTHAGNIKCEIVLGFDGIVSLDAVPKKNAERFRDMVLYTAPELMKGMPVHSKVIICAAMVDSAIDWIKDRLWVINEATRGWDLNDWSTHPLWNEHDMHHYPVLKKAGKVLQMFEGLHVHEMLALMLNGTARCIQHSEIWKRAILCPDYSMCRNRLLYEFDQLTTPTSDQPIGDLLVHTHTISQRSTLGAQ